MLSPFHVCMDVIMVWPLKELYFYGPWINGWGFWAGKENVEICAYLNPTTSQMHWIRNIDECNILVEKHFSTFLVGVKFCMYQYIIYWCLYNILIFVTHLLQQIIVVGMAPASADKKVRTRRSVRLIKKQ